VDRRPVICAFDASKPSMDASLAAAWLAAELRAPLELLHVLDHGALPALPRTGAHRDPGMRAELREDLQRQAEAQARADVEAAVFALDADDATGRVLTGSPVPVLAREAEQLEALLVVTGTAGRRGLEHILHGTVAGELAVRAPCPVAVVPHGAALREPGPVLAGDDGSEHARRAVRHAEALAERLGRPLERIEADEGDAAEALARAGRDRRACVVVVGTRGRGPLRAELFGSVSTGVVRAAGRPVVLVSQHAD
jgi:nucleotide-binding universal stress UspA family protein